MKEDQKMPVIQREGERLVMPGLATAHSHAFQRALRGRTQRRDTQAASFWSWRGLMYALAEQLDPDGLFHISRLAFVELAMSGVTAVGEFHYVHHDPNGRPYANRVAMAEAAIEAAIEAGIRISLIRTAYLQAGLGKTLEPAQRRFADPNVDLVLEDVATLRSRYQDEAMVEVALAAHSIRAVPFAQVRELAIYARQHGLPFHMHVAEQRAEVEESLATYGARPVTLLAEGGLLSQQFVAIHATHLDPAEIEALGTAGAFICLCRTTERDLGDGLPQTAALLEAGAKLCVGVDSHASGDAFEEIRAVELDERSRSEARHVAAEGPDLLLPATQLGYQAIGLGECWTEDKVYLRGDDPALLGLSDELLADGVIFGGTPRAVDEVVVAGQTIVQDGLHINYQAAKQGYLQTLGKLRLI